MLERPVPRRLLLGGAAAGLGLALTGRASTASADTALTIRSASRDARDVRATLASPALSREVPLRVLLPRGYDTDGLRYPVLYLLHGTNGSPDTWLSDGFVRELTADKKLIVVLPDGGHGSWYTNHRHTSLAPMEWESFHLDHMVPSVDHHLRTIPQASGRAIAGFSMGAFGAALYAGRRPWMFGSVSCYSGPLDAFDMQWRTEMYRAPSLDGEPLGAIFGTLPGQENHDDLVAHNPGTYAPALRHHRVRLFAGDTDGYEAKLRHSSEVFRDTLLAAGATNLDGGLIPGGRHDSQCADAALGRDLPDLLRWFPQPQRG